MDENKLRIGGWIAVALLALGQLLPWTYSARPIGQVWDSLFSQISKPNIEWWIWFLAPVAALVLAAKELLNERKVPTSVLLPAALFFATWAALILTGIRRYTGFRYSGFFVTSVALLFIGVVALAGKRRQQIAPRPASHPAPRR